MNYCHELLDQVLDLTFGCRLICIFFNFLMYDLKNYSLHCFKGCFFLLSLLTLKSWEDVSPNSKAEMKTEADSYLSHRRFTDLIRVLSDALQEVFQV